MQKREFTVELALVGLFAVKKLMGRNVTGYIVFSRFGFRKAKKEDWCLLHFDRLQTFGCIF